MDFAPKETLLSMELAPNEALRSVDLSPNEALLSIDLNTADPRCYRWDTDDDDDDAAAADDDDNGFFANGRCREENPTPPSKQPKSLRHAMCSKLRSIAGRTPSP